jgi:hypothetical protein
MLLGRRIPRDAAKSSARHNVANGVGSTPSDAVGRVVAVPRGDDERLRVSELLAAVAANVATVPIVLGFVALGGVVLAGRAVADVAGSALRNRRDTPRLPRGRPQRRVANSPSFGGGELPSQ